MFYVVCIPMLGYSCSSSKISDLSAHIQTCRLNEDLSSNIGERCFYNTGLYVPHASMEICPATLFMQCFTHPTLSTAIFPTVSKKMKRVVTKDESA